MSPDRVLEPDRLLQIVCAQLATDASPWAGRNATETSDTDLIRFATELVQRLLPLGTEADIGSLAAAAVAHVSGLGPLQRFLADPLVNEVMVNNGGDVWVEREGGMALAGRLGEDVTPRLIERILSPLGRRLDRLSPIVDARLADGSRVCAIIPPVAIDGPCLTIRRFGIRRRQIGDFATAAVTDLLLQVIETHCNVLVSGATSSGKTSLLNALASSSVANGRACERIITLEDVAELQLGVPHLLRLETRPANVEGTPAITMTDLVRTALRLRPDRIVVGEIRGGEVIDMLAAMNTGHSGSLSTCHANSALDALRRVESLVLQHSPSWPLSAVRDAVRSSIDVVVHVERHADGGRSVGEVLEVAAPDTSDSHRMLVSGGRIHGTLQRSRR